MNKDDDAAVHMYINVLSLFPAKSVTFALGWQATNPITKKCYGIVVMEKHVGRWIFHWLSVIFDDKPLVLNGPFPFTGEGNAQAAGAVPQRRLQLLHWQPARAGGHPEAVPREDALRRRPVLPREGRLGVRLPLAVVHTTKGSRL